MQQQVFDEKAAADYLALSWRTLQSWRVKGQGPRFLKIGRSVRYREDDLRAFLDGCVVGSTSERPEGIK
jgi:hypothetical protein